MKSSYRFMIFLVVLMAMIGVAQGQSGGTQPDYSNVKDFAGSTHLLRDDDMVITFTYQNPASD